MPLYRFDPDNLGDIESLRDSIEAAFSDHATGGMLPAGTESLGFVISDALAIVGLFRVRGGRLSVVVPNSLISRLWDEARLQDQSMPDLDVFNEIDEAINGHDLQPGTIVLGS